MLTLIRLLLWAVAIAAIAGFAFTLWRAYRRRKHRRAIETVLGWARANARPGVEMDAVRTALLDQGFAPLIEQSVGARQADTCFVKQLTGFPLLHAVDIEIVLSPDDQGRIAAAEHRACRPGGGRL